MLELKMFESLLKSYLASPNAQGETESRLWAEFGRSGVVLILDMSRFSLTVRTSGIVHFLSKIQRMNNVVRQCVGERKPGHIVKFEADNAYCYFSDHKSAIRSALDIRELVKIDNVKYGKHDAIAVSIGVAAGDFLVIPGHGGRSTDYYGDPVNIACKLGEDLAESDQILVEHTDEARSALLEMGLRFNVADLSVSGLHLDVIEIEY